MFKYIKNKELRDLLKKDFSSDGIKKGKINEYVDDLDEDIVLKIIQEDPELARCLPQQFLSNKKVAQTLVKINGSYISLISKIDSSLIDKELALQSVTYKNFFFRADKLDWETYESYSPTKEHVDYSMINDVNDAYNSLSDELKDDINIVKAAYDSYKKITEYLKTAEPLAIYSDGVGINVDTDAMIDIIHNEYLETFEEKYDDLLENLNLKKLKEIATITLGKKDKDNHLNQWDILLHNVKKQVVIVANSKEKYNVNDFTYIIRLKYDENIQENSINLYMYLKSYKGQSILDNIALQKAIRKIKKIDLEIIDIPYNQIEQSVKNFAKEKELYDELSKIAHTFDDFNVELCAMCKKPANRWHQDTWFPFDNTKGMYLCDNCQIMF